MRTIKKINSGHTIIPVRAIVIGAGVCITISVLIAIITAFAINNEYWSIEKTDIISALSQIISAFIGCMVATILAGRMPAVVSAITCGVYVIILICVNILFMDGELGRVGAGTLFILFGGALAVGIKLLAQSNKKIKKPRLH